MKKTLTEQYRLIKDDKGHKGVFLKEAKKLFPNLIRQGATYNEASKILKQKNIITENFVGMSPINNPFEVKKKEGYENAFENFLKEATEVKAEEKKVSKEVEEDQSRGYDNADKKDPNNMIFGQIQMGYYCELKNPKNTDKTDQELLDIVYKNLEKDPIFYTKNGQFGEEGVGYTDEAVSLGIPVEPKGEYKSSGYGTLKENKRRRRKLLKEVMDVEMEDYVSAMYDSDVNQEAEEGFQSDVWSKAEYASNAYDESSIFLELIDHLKSVGGKDVVEGNPDIELELLPNGDIKWSANVTFTEGKLLDEMDIHALPPYGSPGKMSRMDKAKAVLKKEGHSPEEIKAIIDKVMFTPKMDELVAKYEAKINEDMDSLKQEYPSDDELLRIMTKMTKKLGYTPTDYNNDYDNEVDLTKPITDDKGNKYEFLIKNFVALGKNDWDGDGQGSNNVDIMMYVYREDKKSLLKRMFSSGKTDKKRIEQFAYSTQSKQLDKDMDFSNPLTIRKQIIQRTPSAVKSLEKELLDRINRMSDPSDLNEHSIALAGGIVTGGGFVGMNYMDYYGLNEEETNEATDQEVKNEEEILKLKQKQASLSLEENDLEEDMQDVGGDVPTHIEAVADAVEMAYDAGMSTEEIIEFIEQHLGGKYGDY